MSFPNALPPDEARQRWHTEARERDEAYVALGPVDDTERPSTEWVVDLDGDLLADVADMIADWFGRSVIDADRELAAAIITKVHSES